VKTKPNTCWICGAPADSSEHTIKKSDVVRAYGHGPYRGDTAPVHVKSGRVRPVQGPDSRRVKYDHNLCQKCNTAGTQRYDRAYDHFLDWIHSHEPDVLRHRVIDFAEVFGSGWENSQRDLFKYFVKSFGCRIVSSHRTVPKDLIRIFPRDRFRTRLAISFSINEDVLLLPATVQAGFLGKGDLLEYRAHLRSWFAPRYVWHERVSWFETRYWYNHPLEGPCGSPWIANARYIYVGWSRPMPESQRADMLRRIAEEPLS
jgi:hypothetical protein